MEFELFILHMDINDSGADWKANLVLAPVRGQGNPVTKLVTIKSPEVKHLLEQLFEQIFGIRVKEENIRLISLHVEGLKSLDRKQARRIYIIQSADLKAVGEYNTSYESVYRQELKDLLEQLFKIFYD